MLQPPPPHVLASMGTCRPSGSSTEPAWCLPPDVRPGLQGPLGNTTQPYPPAFDLRENEMRGAENRRRTKSSWLHGSGTPGRARVGTWLPQPQLWGARPGPRLPLPCGSWLTGHMLFSFRNLLQLAASGGLRLHRCGRRHHSDGLPGLYRCCQ